MKKVIVMYLLVIAVLVFSACQAGSPTSTPTPSSNSTSTPGSDPTPTAAPNTEDDPFGNAQKMIEEGRQTFRFDTFGDEDFWGGELKLHQAIAGEENGGVGPGLSPKQALAVGLKVDIASLPETVVQALQDQKLDLDDPKTTLTLLKANAVVGVTGFFDDNDQIVSIGIQCALCHSTTTDPLADLGLAGIGARLDGWPNRDLNVGAIVAMAPDVSPFTDLLKAADPTITDETVRTVLNSWGPGKFDAELVLDGKAFRPDGKSGATLLPPAFGLAGVNEHTWTGGWGTVSYWNAFVANLEMHGKGNFYDPRLDNAEQYPVAAAAQLGHTQAEEDLITPKLPALHFYQLSLPVPRPPDGTFNQDAAERGRALFNGQARCATCHVPPLFTEPGWNLHPAEDIGIDDFQAMRGPAQMYRTTPLRALWSSDKIHKGGFYHDGRFATLEDVVNHYNTFMNLNLTPEHIQDLIEYLKSL